MGNACCTESERKNQDIHVVDKSQIRPAQAKESLIPERQATSPRVGQDGVSAVFAETKDLNEMHPKVKVALEKRRLRDVRSFPELKEHFASPLNKLKDSASGDTYHGQVVRGVPHGWGYLISKIGEVIEGLFENGRPHSHLRHVAVDGTDYEGELKGEIRHGRGTVHRPDGTSLLCQTWVNGTPTGLVEEKDFAGRIIFRGVRNEKGLYQGICTVGYKEFTVDGEYKDGLLTGECRKSYLDGRVYQGPLNKDLLEEGNGQITFVDGRRFKGPFARGLANGKGTFTSDDGKTSEQTWKEGRRV
jgi:hypothetical protein